MQNIYNLLLLASNVLAEAVIGYQQYIGYTLTAIGAAVLFALSSLSATTWWTVAMVKKAFTAVVKRALSPIGIAVAVISFGMCVAAADGIIKVSPYYFIFIPLILGLLYKNYGLTVMACIRTKNYSRLKGTLLFLLISILLIVGIIWLIETVALK